MARTLFYVDKIDNTGTLYQDVISHLYAQSEWNLMLANTKFLRNSILKMIKEFIEREGTVFIKEFSDAPAMIYDDPTKFNFGIEEVSTDFIVVKEAFNMTKLNVEHNKIPAKYSLVLEALNPAAVTKVKWDDYLNEVYLNYAGDGVRNPRVQKIVVENVIQLLKKWEDVPDQTTKDMIKGYNQSQGIITYDRNTFWQQPLSLISKKFWEKFSFVLTINDYEIYDAANQKYLDVISEKYFNNGYFDEVVIKMNYFYWHDNYQKIIDWTTQNLKSTLVSYRFDTLFSNNTKNRYYDDAQAALYGDTQRKNTVDEELTMFDTQLPLFLNQILKNPQSCGFELMGGYFGKEGYVPNLEIGSSSFEDYKLIMCKSLEISPFAKSNDYFQMIFRDPLKKVFICLKR